MFLILKDLFLARRFGTDIPSSFLTFVELKFYSLKSKFAFVMFSVFKDSGSTCSPLQWKGSSKFCSQWSREEDQGKEAHLLRHTDFRKCSTIQCSRVLPCWTGRPEGPLISAALCFQPVLIHKKNL